MKRSQSVPWIIILLLLILLIYREFGRGGGIPVDRERAKEHIITMKDARAYTHAFDSAKDELQGQLRDSSYLSTRFKLPVCELFNKDAIGALLNKKGTDGIRVYLGLNREREVVFVLVPVDGQGKDLRGKLFAQNNFWIPGVSTAYAQDPELELEDEEAVERGHRCPHSCDIGSPLVP
ncbi:hypothetical protein AAHN97_06090 [Chitinophaga niabensis]|uniref:hypothetical protein n=1 Tax=Chitinophaga niabensis TaxID=536979 RepID=UPI0031BA569A